jgi:hypothetical protein
MAIGKICGRVAGLRAIELARQSDYGQACADHLCGFEFHCLVSRLLVQINDEKYD